MYLLGSLFEEQILFKEGDIFVLSMLPDKLAVVLPVNYLLPAARKDMVDVDYSAGG